jgi:O-antigen ligase
MTQILTRGPNGIESISTTTRVVSFTIGFLLIQLSGTSEWVFCLVAVAAVLSLAISEREKSSFCLLDFAILLFYLSSVLSTYFAYDSKTSLPQMQLRTIFTLLYTVVRSSSEVLQRALIGSIFGAILKAVLSLSYFFRSYDAWMELGFPHIVDFRAFVTLMPFPIRPGDHNACYVAVLTFCFYSFRQNRLRSGITKYLLLLSAGLSSVCILLSFSRSLYLATMICILFGLPETIAMDKQRPRIRPVLTGISVLAISVILVGILYGPLFKGVIETAELYRRPTQRLSVEGRAAIYRSALPLVRNADFAGFGVSNYALAVRRQQLDVPLTARPLNLYLQVAIEQGVLGIVSLIIWLAAIVRSLWNRASSTGRLSLAGGCLALIVYGMAQNFLIADIPTATVLAILFALLADARG